jgi:hypothetical protein
MKIVQNVIGIGELLWDVLPDGKKLGGAPCNFVYHAQKQGAKGLALSAVGNDPGHARTWLVDDPRHCRKRGQPR